MKRRFDLLSIETEIAKRSSMFEQEQPATMSGVLAFAMYRAKEGLEAELEQEVKLHLGKLLELKLINEKNSFSGQSTDGTIIAIFEWASKEAKSSAHEHPDLAGIWNNIIKICDFPAMKDLPEAHSPFPNFGAL